MMLLNVSTGDKQMSDLNWDASYAIARKLHQNHPDVDLEEVSLEMIYQWTLALPGFSDDPDLVNDAILLSIYQEWYEEINPL
jgi:FeS assembly protein IscX